MKVTLCFGAVALIFLNYGCSTFYYNMPTSDAANANSGNFAGLAPETICREVRDGAYNRRTGDSVVGVLLSALGAGSASAGLTVAVLDETDKHRVEGATVAGLGAIAIAGGIYFLTRSGDDRAEYWVMNGALAQMRADRLQGVQSNGDPSKSLRAWALDMKDKANTAASNSALASAQATEADATVTMLQQYDLKKYDLKTADSGLKTVTPPVPRDGNGNPIDLDTALENARRAHAAADGANKASLDAAATAALAASALASEQLAWTDCSKALSSISGNDAAASTAFATAVAGSVKAPSK
jgi:hypothetical protein